MDVVMTMKVWKIQNVLNKNLAIGDKNIFFTTVCQIWKIQNVARVT